MSHSFYFKKILPLVLLLAGSTLTSADPLAPANPSNATEKKAGQIRSAASALLNSPEITALEAELTKSYDDVKLTVLKLSKTTRTPGGSPKIHFSLTYSLRSGTEEYTSNTYQAELTFQKVALGPATTGLAFVVTSLK